jgi:uncharacterized protein YndB with AHSA1/START domain
MGVTVDHRSFVITRDLPGSPRHAYRFWAEIDLKRRWMSCHPDWSVIEDHFDFRIDGSEVMRWRMPDGTEQEMLAHFLEIYPAQRIVYAYTMRTNGAPISSSLVTVEFTDSDAGATRMTFTEQAVFGNAADGEMRQSGTGIGLDRLVAAMVES